MDTLTRVSLEDRLQSGEMTRSALRARAEAYFTILDDDNPIVIGGERGCPVCLSILENGVRLVRENGYIVCDNCVDHVEAGF